MNDEIVIKPVVGFEGRYSVTSTGRVISHVGTNTKKGHVMGAGVPGKYCLLMLRKDGKTHPRSAHRLVCEAFHGPRPSQDHCVNHKNGIKSDNRPENLEWVTQLENVKHAVETGLMLKKLTLRDRHLIKSLYSSGVSQRKIGKAFGVTSAYVSQVCSNWTERRRIRRENGWYDGVIIINSRED